MNDSTNDALCFTTQREKRRQILILACELDRLEWRLERRRQSRPWARILGFFEFAQPFLPRYLRYATMGYSLASQLFRKR